MIKNIIFDFDGTIGDTAENTIHILNQIAGEKGYRQITEDDISGLMNMSARKALREFKVPIWKLPWLIRSVRPRIFETIQNCKPFPGIVQTIQSLSKDYDLFIFTSNSVENVEKFLEHHQIENYFTSIGSESNLFYKNRGLKRFLKQNNLQKEECIYVGDEVRDLQACRRVEIQCISVTWGINSKEFLEKHNPDFLIEKPEGILDVLNTL